MSNAILDITIHRSNSSPVTYRTSDYEDINHARREYQKMIAGTQSLIIADSDDAGFQLIPVRNITGIKVREVYPDEERKKAEEKQRAELKQVPVQRRLPND